MKLIIFLPSKKKQIELILNKIDKLNEDTTQFKEKINEINNKIGILEKENYQLKESNGNILKQIK